jgi:archaeal flagellin FlaB
MKAPGRWLHSQKGMTGLETAIILIAFVTVAAVFGYAILSAGLFSAQRGKEGIYVALNGAKTNLEISGSVIAESDNVTYNPLTVVGKIKFNVRNTAGGVPVDLTPNVDRNLHENKCVISLTTRYDHIEDVQWTFVPVGDDNGNNLLETGEQFEINIDIQNLTPAGCPLTVPMGLLKENDIFILLVKPSAGSTFDIRRQLPPALDAVMDLH